MQSETTSSPVEDARQGAEGNRAATSGTIDDAGEAGDSPTRFGDVGEGAEAHHGRSGSSDAIDREGEAGKAMPQAEGAGGLVESRPGRATVSAANERESSSMDNSHWQQILVALERQRTENAERDAARARENAERDAARAKEIADLRVYITERDAAREKENAERDAAREKENAERDAARAKEIADLRADITERDAANAERDAARSREIAELRVAIARYGEKTVELFKDQTRTMMYIAAVLIAAIGVAVTVQGYWNMQAGTHPSYLYAPPAQSYQSGAYSQTGADASGRENAQPPQSPR